MNTLDEYAIKLGKFWINFNSLELLLRLYLTRKNSESEVGLELQVGDSCQATHLTNYDTFDVLARKYNALVDVNNKINFHSIIKLRDAIAHGRVTAMNNVPMTIIKYSKPDKASGNVTVELKETLSTDLFDSVTKEMYDMIQILSRFVNAKLVNRVIRRL